MSLALASPALALNSPTIDYGHCDAAINTLTISHGGVDHTGYRIYRATSADLGVTWTAETNTQYVTGSATWDTAVDGTTGFSYRVRSTKDDGATLGPFSAHTFYCNAWAPPGAGGSAGAPLLTDSEAAAWVTATTEKTSLATSNATPNACDVIGTCLTQAKIDSYHGLKERANYQSVDGLAGFVAPSTDMLIQWVSAKYGLIPDWVRAQMSHESDWHQQGAYGSGGQNSDQGDVCNLAVAQNCDDNAVHTDWFTLYPSQSRVISTCTSDCRVGESMGIGQIKWRPSNTRGSGTNPLRWESTAFNLDHYGATMRGWFDNAYGHGNGGNPWAAVCAWFTGDVNSCDTSYTDDVQARLAAKTWNGY